LRIRSGRTETCLARLAALELSAAMKTTLAPLRSLIDLVDDELVTADEQLQVLVAGDPTVKRLTTLPGIGPITASAFVAALDVASRFEHTNQVAGYAHPHLQSLLVQAAWRVWRASDPRTAAFRTWAQDVARRRGKKVAIVALARRLARTLFAMWRDEADYQPRRIRTRGLQPVEDAIADTGVSASV
jgi:transposase